MTPHGHIETPRLSALRFEIEQAEEGGYQLKLNGEFAAARSSLAEAVFWMGQKLADKYRETPYLQHAPIVTAPAVGRQATAAHPQPHAQPAEPPPVGDADRFPSVVTREPADTRTSASLLEQLQDRLAVQGHTIKRNVAPAAFFFGWGIAMSLWAMSLLGHA